MPCAHRTGIPVRPSVHPCGRMHDACPREPLCVSCGLMQISMWACEGPCVSVCSSAWACALVCEASVSFLKLFITCMYVCMYAQHAYSTHYNQQGAPCPLELIDSWFSGCGCWESNPSSLQSRAHSQLWAVPPAQGTFLFFLFLFETWSHYITLHVLELTLAQAGLKL